MVSLMLERRYAPLDNTFHDISPSPFTPRKRSKSFSYETFDMEKNISTASLQESHILSSKQSSNQDQPLAVTSDAESGIYAEESRKTSIAKVCMTESCESMDIEDPSGMSKEKKSVETCSPTLPRLLGAIRAEISNAYISTSKAQCAGNSVSIDTHSDLARACAQSAREAFLQRHRRIASRKTFFEKENLSNHSGTVEGKVDMRSPELLGYTMQKHKPSDFGCSTSPFPRLLDSVLMQMPNSHNTSDIRDMTCDAELIAIDCNFDTPDAARACAQIALEAFRAYQHRVINRNSVAVP